MRQGPHKNRSRTRGRRPTNQSGRVYESNGPDVKVRGTAQTVADKYLQLARDALSSGDPVMAEGYFQHAEHYLRILAATQPYPQQNMASRRDDYADDDGDDGDDDQPGPVSSGMGSGGGNGEAQRQQQPQQYQPQQPQYQPQQPQYQPQPQPQSRPPQPAIAPPAGDGATGDQPWGGPEPEFLRRGPGNGAGRTRRTRHPRSDNGRSETATSRDGSEDTGSAGEAADTAGRDTTDQV